MNPEQQWESLGGFISFVATRARGRRREILNDTCPGCHKRFAPSDPVVVAKGPARTSLIVHAACLRPAERGGQFVIVEPSEPQAVSWPLWVLLAGLVALLLALVAR